MCIISIFIYVVKHFFKKILKSHFFIVFLQKIKTMSTKIIELLGKDADNLLTHTCKGITKEQIHVPTPTHVDDIWRNSNRNNQTLYPELSSC